MNNFAYLLILKYIQVNDKRKKENKKKKIKKEITMSIIFKNVIKNNKINF